MPDLCTVASQMQSSTSVISKCVSPGHADACRIHYQRLLAPFLGAAVQAKAEAPLELQVRAASSTGSDVDPNNQANQPVAAAEDTLQANEAGPERTALEDSTMLQHQAVLNARLQNEPDLGDAAQEDGLVVLPDVVSTFKSALVDSSDPIPGL